MFSAKLWKPSLLERVSVRGKRAHEVKSFRTLQGIMMGVVKCAAWLALVPLAIASLVPGQYRPSIGLDGGFEHLLAYAAASATFILAYSLHWRRVLIGLCTLAGMFELLQLFVPGRDAQIESFVFSCLGVVAGSLITSSVVRLLSARGAFR